jgi:hypothetical protein
MKKKLFYIIIGLGIFSGISSLAFTNNTVATGFAIVESEARLIAIEQEYQEYESEYLNIVLDNLGDTAINNGFIVSNTPKYLNPDTIVGYLAE